MNGRIVPRLKKKSLVSFLLKIVMALTYKNSDNNGIKKRVSNIPPSMRNMDWLAPKRTFKLLIIPMVIDPQIVFFKNLLYEKIKVTIVRVIINVYHPIIAEIVREYKKDIAIIIKAFFFDILLDGKGRQGLSFLSIFISK
jgi:hypothetical protein